jgi:hypothetical protein
MLLNFTREERDLLATVDACVDIPRSTKPAVARKLYDNLKALIATLRGLPPAVLEARGLSLHTKRGTRVADARALLSKYQVPAEELIPRRRVYGDGTALEDACLQLRAAAYARQGFGFEVQFPRYEPGQTADPTDSLRTDFDWDAEWWDRSEHERAAAFHRARASKATSMEKCCDEHKAADLHDTAARIYPYGDGASARAASKNLLRGKENCL